MIGDDDTVALIKKVEKDMKNHPFLMNSHKIYEMTREEL